MEVACCKTAQKQPLLWTGDIVSSLILQEVLVVSRNRNHKCPANVGVSSSLGIMQTAPEFYFYDGTNILLH